VAAQPKDSAPENFYIREGVKGRDKQPAEEGKVKEKKNRKGEVIRPLKGDRRGGPSKHCDKNVERHHRCLDSRLFLL
jgi:hypothetical protein